jgi:hypothetical protein
MSSTLVPSSERGRAAGGSGFVRQDRASMLPAGLAALAEVAVWYLPFKGLVVDAVHATAGPLVSYPALVALFVGSVVISTGLRRLRGLRTALIAGAVGIGVLQAQVWGAGTVYATLAGVVLALAAGLRVVALASRDWREPMRLAFGLGAAALLLEVLIASGGVSEWRPLLVPLIAQFFSAMLASRAASLWLANRGVREAANPGAASRSARATVAMLGGLGLVLLMVFVFGRRGGALQVVGDGLFRFGTDVIEWMAWVIAKVVLRPFDWAFRALNINLRGLRSAAGSLEAFGKKPPAKVPARHETLNRLLGLLFMAALGLLLVRSIRGRRDLAQRFAGTDLRGPDVEVAPFGAFRARGRRRRERRELPENVVRRWYAQALLALERRGLPKSPSLTPGEYLIEIRVAVPACAGEFAVLTRAYEDVRYGNRPFDAESVARLEPHQTLLMQSLRRLDSTRAT